MYIFISYLIYIFIISNFSFDFLTVGQINRATTNGLHNMIQIGNCISFENKINNMKYKKKFLLLSERLKSIHIGDAGVGRF